LLKWAGGKRQLLPHLRRFYPPAFNRYIEPFFGSGAVFFDLHAAGRLRDREVVLIDSNADLIGCYETVRAEPEAVVRELEGLAAAHASGGQTQYYAVRDQQFNPIRDRLRARDGRIAYTPQLAAMLIYLNRTGFNGLFRLNSRGEFNVPAGRYDRPKIADRDKLARVAEALSGSRLRLLWGSFESVREIAARGDFVYFDPPYDPVTPTANFTSYSANGFGPDDQRALADAARKLVARGAYVMLSNSDTPFIRSIYRGFRVDRVKCSRAINSNAAKRGDVDEVIVTGGY
jgi:DNA adenine methylase